MKRLTSARLTSKQWLYLFLGTTFTVIFLAWAFQGGSLTEVWTTLKQAKPEWILLAWIAYLSTYWLRAQRWGRLLKTNFQPGRFNSRLAALFIGYGSNTFLPAHSGELVRAAVLHRRDGIPFEAAVGSMFAERLLDIGVVYLLLLLPLWLGALPEHPTLSTLPLGWLGAALALIWVSLVFAASFPKKLTYLAGMISQRVGLGKYQVVIISTLDRFLKGLGVLRKRRQTLLALGETVLIWTVNGITFWAAMIGFGIISPGYLGALFTQSMAGFAIALPSTPGHIGPFEAAIRFSLNLYELPVNTIIAYAIVLRFLMHMTIPIIALLFVVKLNQQRTSFPKKIIPSGNPE